MSLTLLLLLLSVLFIMPAILLPRNRLVTYSVSAIIASLLIGVFITVNAFVAAFSVEDTIGSFLSPLFSFAYRNDMTTAEMNHLSLWFFYLFLWLLSYLVSYLVVRAVYIGFNPSVKRTSNVFFKALGIIMFIAFTYIPFALFLIEIRTALPLSDGFLGSFFQLIHSIEA